MVRRLVAVGIHADKTCDIDLLATAHSVMPLEEAVKEGDGLLLAANELHPGINVVRHVGTILPAVGLGEVVVDLGGVEGCHPTAVALGMAEAVAVDNILPALAANPIGAGRGAVAHNLGHLGDTPVIVGIFESFRNTLVVDL